MALLTVEQLSLNFGNTAVLKSLHLAVEDNEIVCLLGASGCGKTTLLKAIAGLLPISDGDIRLGGQCVQRLPIEQRKIGLIFQDYALFPHLTVAENIGFGLSHLTHVEQQALITQMLAVVKLQGFERRYPHELSGGQQQRVAIARALACRPALLLLDEPFSNIDSQTRYAMIQEIKQILKSQGVPAIFVTHSKEEAFAFADKIAVMDQGQIVQFGKPNELYHAPVNPFVADFLGGTNYLKCTVSDEKLLRSPIGEYRLFPEMAVNKGHYAWLLRPEQLRLKLSAQGHGIIQHKLFLGLYYRYQVAINDMLLTVFQSEDFPLGERVEVRFHIREFILFAEQKEA